MRFEKLFVFDADQYPLYSNLDLNELNDSYVIAASNAKHKLFVNGNNYNNPSIQTKVVDTLPESADAYLVSALYSFLENHRVEKIIIASRDKKLMQMLLCLSTSYSKATKYLHSCCRRNIAFSLDEFEVEEYWEPYRILTNIEQKIIEHISQYPNGLKVKTLSYHYGMSKEKMSEIMGKLERTQQIIRYFNCYHANKTLL